MWNGEYRERTHDTKPCDEIQEMSKPFRVHYRDGLCTNFSIKNEPAWATNIKRSIAGILQLDLANLEKQVAFHSVEVSFSNFLYSFLLNKNVLSNSQKEDQFFKNYSKNRQKLINFFLFRPITMVSA